LFKAQIEGREVWALLDNGCDFTVIDRRFAKARGLRVGRPVGLLRTATGSLEHSIVSDVDIVIPGQARLRGAFFAADLSMASRSLGKPIALILGKEVFRDTAVLIRPSENSFEFWPSTALSLPPEAPRLPLPKDARELVLKNDVPQLDILIAGKPAMLTVDLGSNDVIALSEAAWARLGLNNHATTVGQSVGAEGRPVATRTTVVSDISVGSVPGFEASVTEKPILAAMGDGLIGMGYFRHFNFAIDLKARRLWLISPVAGSSNAASPAPGEGSTR
jgi:predicted aspartyl protease